MEPSETPGPAHRAPTTLSLAASQPGGAQAAMPATIAGTRAKWLGWARLVGKWAGRIALGVCVLWLSLILLYRFVNPPFSTLMLGQALLGRPINQQWVPLEAISPNLIKAVVMSEDDQFCEHWGVDWTAMKDAIRQGGRGASTISMQTVKNVLLWPSRSYLRKAIELPVAYVADLVWGKPRMLEIYLNVAEWGPGVFGVEAAAQHHFKQSASKLSSHQSALLAASLPNPHKRTAGQPGPKVRAHAARLQKRTVGADDYVFCVLPNR